MQRVDQRGIELQQRLAAGADDETPVAAGAAPDGSDGLGQGRGIIETPAVFAVGADKVRVAEAALGRGAVLLAAGPQVAAGKTAEHGSAAGLAALALQRLEDFLDRVAHGVTCRVVWPGGRADRKSTSLNFCH